MYTKSADAVGSAHAGERYTAESVYKADSLPTHKSVYIVKGVDTCKSVPKAESMHTV